MIIDDPATIGTTRKRTRRNAIHPRSNDADMLREFSLQYQMRTVTIAPPATPTVIEESSCQTAPSINNENRNNSENSHLPSTADTTDDNSSHSSIPPYSFPVPPSSSATYPLIERSSFTNHEDMYETNDKVTPLPPHLAISFQPIVTTRILPLPPSLNASKHRTESNSSIGTEAEEEEDIVTPSTKSPVKKRRKTEEKEEELRSIAKDALSSASQLS